jgi:peptidoglycan/LPS O-acetylase OafA/YrhL
VTRPFAPSAPGQEAVRRPRPPRATVVAAVLDVASIVVFVAIGRRSHDEGGSVIGGIGKVAAPFLIALAVGWIAARAWRSPTSRRTAAIVWVVTVALGMLLRHTVFDRGTATSFIIVTAIFTGVLLFGWRAIANRVVATRG